MIDDAGVSGVFGVRLGACRRPAGLSQEELAERAGLSVRTISNLERGRTRWPHPESVRRLADALALTGEKRGEFLAAAARRLARDVTTASPRTPEDRSPQAADGQADSVQSPALTAQGGVGYLGRPPGCA